MLKRLLPLLLLLQGIVLQAADPPNIVFIFTDDHAYQAISAYGSDRNHTPNIDRLAREGMLFRNAMVTNSICAPSRAAILTGKYSHLNTVTNNSDVFDGTQQTFPKLLQGAGYQTALFGKWHLKSVPTGFDSWEVLPGQGHYYNPDFRVAPDNRHQRPGYVTDVITDLALDWLKDDRDSDKPFMMMLQHKAPHRNWMPGPEQLSLYDGVEIPEPPSLFDTYEGRAQVAQQQTMEVGQHLTLHNDLKVMPEAGTPEHDSFMNYYGRMTPEQRAMWDAAYEPKNEAMKSANLRGRDLVRWKYQRYIKDYLRCIASVDDNVGRVLRYLDANGLAENTIVIYSSDQGFYLGEHGWFDKRWMFDESLKTPLLVRWPGVIEPNRESEELVSNIDFAETFLDIAGVEIPTDMQGQSLVPIFKGETPSDWRTSFYYQYYEGPPLSAPHNVARHYGVATKRYKLIHYYVADEWELFDLQTDPLELQSRYGEDEYKDVQARLLTELNRLRVELKIPDTDPDLLAASP